MKKEKYALFSASPEVYPPDKGVRTQHDVFYQSYLGFMVACAATYTKDTETQPDIQGSSLSLTSKRVKKRFLPQASPAAAKNQHLGI